MNGSHYVNLLGYDMTPKQHDIYIYVMEFEKRLGRTPTQTEIARKMGVSQQTISATLKRLVAMGAMWKSENGRGRIRAVKP